MSDVDPKVTTPEAVAVTIEGEKDARKNSPQTTESDHNVSHVETAKSDNVPPVLTFAIEMKDKNTAKNPDHESTQTFPTLVRRIDSQELLPRPFKTTTQLVCVSYLSLLCCCFFGAFAVKRAWNTKLKRNNGLYTSATKDAKWTCYYLIAALAMGSAIYIILAVTLSLEFA